MRTLGDTLGRSLPGLGALCVAALFVGLIDPARLGGVAWPVGLGVLSFAWVLSTARRAGADGFFTAAAIVLMAAGLAVIARISPDLAQRQEQWIAVALVLGIAARGLFERFRALASYRYIWVLGSLVLFVALMLFGTEVNGARLWIRFGPALQVEPIEIIKVFIVFFLAAYLAETADVIAGGRWWSLRANLKYLGPLIIGWGASMSILVLQRDLGMAMLLLAIFTVMLYAATRRADLIAGGFVVFCGVAAWAAHHYPYVADRIAVWRNPYRDPLGSGYQALQALYTIAAGGLTGTGYRLGRPDYIPEAATDYVWAAWSEEFGLLGALVLLALYALLVLRTFDAARRAPDPYAKLLAVGLGTMLGVQVLIIIGGVNGLLPLTGITLPFMSYGGSSLVMNVLVVVLVTTISADPRGTAAREVDEARIRDVR